MTAVSEHVAIIAVQEVERLESETRTLRAQRDHFIEKVAVLQTQKTEAEIRLQTQLLKVHSDYLDRLTALEAAVDRIANTVQGLPGRAEFDLLKNEHYALSYRVPV